MFPQICVPATTMESITTGHKLSQLAAKNSKYVQYDGPCLLSVKKTSFFPISYVRMLPYIICLASPFSACQDQKWITVSAIDCPGKCIFQQHVRQTFRKCENVFFQIFE